MQMDRRRWLRLNKKMIGASFGKIAKITFRVDDHQVHIERLRRRSTNRIHNRRTEGDVWHEPAVHDVNMNPIGACLIDGTDFLTNSPQIRGKNRGCNNDRLHGVPGTITLARWKMNRSIALAKPSSRLLSVTKSAARCTSGVALPIAMLRPLRSNIATSLPPSPITAISTNGTANSFASSDNAAPLLASGWVMSR